MTKRQIIQEALIEYEEELAEEAEREARLVAEEQEMWEAFLVDQREEEDQLSWFDDDSYADDGYDDFLDNPQAYPGHPYAHVRPW